MKHVPFYATCADLLKVLNAIEQSHALQYRGMGNFASTDTPLYLQASQIPHIGEADRDTGSTGRSFLVTTHGTPVAWRTIRGMDGSHRYLMDQLENPDTVVLTPGGRWTRDILLNGQVSTASDSPLAQDLMRWFGSEIRGHFTKVKAFRVGQEALALLRDGKRLTLSANTPEEFDLKE